MKGVPDAEPLSWPGVALGVALVTYGAVKLLGAAATLALPPERAERVPLLGRDHSAAGLAITLFFLGFGTWTLMHGLVLAGVVHRPAWLVRVFRPAALRVLYAVLGALLLGFFLAVLHTDVMGKDADNTLEYQLVGVLGGASFLAWAAADLAYRRLRGAVVVREEQRRPHSGPRIV